MHHLSPAQRRWRRLRRSLKGVIAFAVIGMAVVLGTVGLALPWLVSHPEKVQAFLSERLNRPVRFGHLRGDWKPTGPVFTLEQVELGDPASADDSFRIDRAELDINFYAWLRKGVSFSEFRLDGLEIEAERDADDNWRIARLGRGGKSAGGANALLRLGSVSLRQAKVTVIDLRRNTRVVLDRVDLRLLNDRNGRRVGGIAWAVADSPPIRFACELASDDAGRCFIGADNVAPAQWLESMPVFGVAPVRGEVTAKIWVRFDHGLREVRVDAETDGLVLRGTTPIEFSDHDLIEPRAALPRWRVAARWQRNAEGWRADVLDWDGPLEPTPSLHLRLDAAVAADGTRYALDANRLDLARFAPLIALSDALPAGVRDVLYESAPRGVFSALSLARDEHGGISGRGRVSDLALAPGSRLPGVASIDADIIADAGALIVMPDPEQALVFDYPHVFRQAIAMTLHSATIGVVDTPDGMRVEVVDLDLDGEGFGLAGRASLLFDHDGVRPTLDATLAIKNGTIAAAKQFWPLNVMPERTRDWLDRGLVDGRIVAGSAVVFGDLDHWPFVDSSGRFEARATIEELQLNYHPRWPQAHIARTEAAFIDNSMHIDSYQGTALGVAVGSATADIANMKEGVLELRATGSGSGENLLEFLRTSPINDKIGSYLLGMTVGGTGEVEFGLHLPLKAELGAPRTLGSVLLHDADIHDAKWSLDFAKANGRLRFSDKGFATDDLAVRVGEDPAALSIASGEFVVDPGHQTEATLRGELPVSSLLNGYDTLAVMLPLMPGRSDWTVDLTVDAKPAGDSDDHVSAKRVRLRSDLRGTALLLPAPLSKDADTAMPVDMQLSLPAAGGTLALTLGKLMRLDARLAGPDLAFAGRARLGVAESGPLPKEGLIVRGDALAVDLGGWMNFGGVASGGSLDVDVRAEQLRMMSRSFDDTQFTYTSDERERRVTLAGPAVEGTVVIPLGADAANGISAEFTRLHVSEGDPKQPVAPFDPAHLPPLHVWAKDLSFGSAQLGEAHIETFPVATGLRVERWETSSPNIEIRAHGDWLYQGGAESSRFDITFTAQSLGKMLDALGFVGMVDGGQTIARIDGSWLGSPGQFSLSKIDGTLETTVGKGRFLEVNPGAGRVFGLISLQALPRRLSLDFSDFFDSGLAFDTISGKFELKTGDAFTENLEVKGPSAEIKVRGRTGLIKRDYDQEIEVTPKVGGVLPVVGAIAGGPVGAAAGFVVQNMLSWPIDQVVRARYKVTGGWEKPDIVLIAKERARTGTNTPPAQPKPGE